MKLDGKGSVDGDGRIPKFPRGCLADTLSAVEFVPNPDQREPGDWSSDSSDDSGSDDVAFGGHGCRECLLFLKSGLLFLGRPVG